MKQKKEYRRPEMLVVKLRHTGMLMTSPNGVDASRSIYSHGRTDAGRS